MVGLPNHFEHVLSIAALFHKDYAEFTGSLLILVLVGLIGCQPVIAAHHDDRYLAEHRHKRTGPRCPLVNTVQPH